MFIFLTFTLTIILLFLLLSMVWPPDSPWSPWWRTSKKISKIMCRLAKIDKNDVIYDLGSGDGQALITASKLGARGVGIEIDPIRVWVSKIWLNISSKSEKIKIVRKNFFEVDLSNATVIFAYLVPKTLARLKPKFLKELKPGTRIVTFVYKIDLPLVASDKKNEVYVFEIPKRYSPLSGSLDRNRKV
ncbi:MAG TPA: 50S ribosomal protein L11 methyltransferase [Xanthomonadales bacterium]|nr:50S ribosomal protein L11 methyltransferase [Xanthomonadales bacterium]